MNNIQLLKMRRYLNGQFKTFINEKIFLYLSALKSNKFLLLFIILYKCLVVLVVALPNLVSKKYKMPYLLASIQNSMPKFSFYSVNALFNTNSNNKAIKIEGCLCYTETKYLKDIIYKSKYEICLIYIKIFCWG